MNVRPTLCDDDDDAEYPNVLNFCLSDNGTSEILRQPAPQLCEISVAFPLNHAWQALQDMACREKTKMFLANPPTPGIRLEDLTAMQRFAYDCMVDEQSRVLYVSGRAGSGKSTVALLACQHFGQRIQCCASTGRAASIFDGPTVHSAMQWSLRGSSLTNPNKIAEMRVFYENVDVFLVDEVNALSAECFAMLHDTLSLVFNPQNKKNSDGEILPFGGKKMIFLGDPAQLKPVLGAPISDENVETSGTRKRKAGRQLEMNLKGQLLYRKYLLTNTILLNKGQRNVGLLQGICDRLRDGHQTNEDLRKLTFLRRKFPEAQSDHGVFFDNERCGERNIRELWNDCRSETSSRRLYVCKATYEETGSNQAVVDALAALPAKVFNYSPNVLCLSDMCLVRITRNINVGSGLVNGAIGRVLQVVYENSDIPFLLEGKHPPPYCVLVQFDGFQGFVLDSSKPDDRFFPFEERRNVVPIYPEKIQPDIRDLPQMVRKKQNASLCYRKQFPLDLAMNMTAHRSQGQTLGDCVVSVDMNLENPDTKLPNEIASLMYVALTRVRRLRDLLVSPIFPEIWLKIGKSEMDERRRKADARLLKAAEEFAMNRGMLQEFQDELRFKPLYGNLDEEWEEIQSMAESPGRKIPVPPLTRAEVLGLRFKITTAGEVSSHVMYLTPVLCERYVGIDQGTNNFARS